MIYFSLRLHDWNTSYQILYIYIAFEQYKNARDAYFAYGFRVSILRHLYYMVRKIENARPGFIYQIQYYRSIFLPWPKSHQFTYSASLNSESENAAYSRISVIYLSTIFITAILYRIAAVTTPALLIYR
jgi:hypothetical protein